MIFLIIQNLLVLFLINLPNIEDTVSISEVAKTKINTEIINNKLRLLSDEYNKYITS